MAHESEFSRTINAPLRISTPRVAGSSPAGIATSQLCDEKNLFGREGAPQGGRYPITALPDEFDAQHPAAAPNHLAWLSFSVSKSEFEPSRNHAGSIRDDFCSSPRDVHDRAFRGGHAIECDPRRLAPNSSDLSVLLFWLH
jgi:hypothetical protein